VRGACSKRFTLFQIVDDAKLPAGCSGPNAGCYLAVRLADPGCLLADSWLLFDNSQLCLKPLLEKVKYR